MESENILITDKHVLICLGTFSVDPELEYLKKNFCGIVLTDDINSIVTAKNIYLCGNIGKLNESTINTCYDIVYVIKDLSINYEELHIKHTLIDTGEVPINIHGVGVYFRKLFNSENYFDKINNSHEFQVLTESDKPSDAYRKGIYLTKVEENNNEYKFNLLRCSSNLKGPTDNFRDVDNEIITRVNDIGQQFFEQKVELNHVLAQIYVNNSKAKAKIRAHSDKTKDMPKNGLIAFCTFYDDGLNNKLIKKSDTDMFDYCYKETSVLTKLIFKLKSCVMDEKLTKEFNIVLYPNSVFIIPLSTNRLYTHEIRPSILSFDRIPVRMGYVIRKSNTDAVHKNNQTYIVQNGTTHELIDADKEKINEIRALYYIENTTDKIVEYPDTYFSMNSGDYSKPLL